jgi:hypothetical protein
VQTGCFPTRWLGLGAVYMHKEWFPNHRKSKFQPCGDSPFQVLERINDNAYRVGLPVEYGVSATFNIVDFTLFDTCFNSRSNLFEISIEWTSCTSLG